MITDTIHEHLKDIQTTKIKDIVTKPTIIESTDTLSSVINKINRNKAYDAFYINGKNTFATNVLTLLNAKNITSMKIEPYLSPIPSVSLNDSIQKASHIMTHYRTREVPVV
ncbi:MAG: histidine kinase, partial [Candidatus Lokiarchaeia archaeon]|nr:histidine kinase [Candidatus Lokiarchaeia archaeon]